MWNWDDDNSIGALSANADTVDFASLSVAIAVRHHRQAAAVTAQTYVLRKFCPVLITLAKTEITYPKNVRAKVAMDFT